MTVQDILLRLRALGSVHFYKALSDSDFEELNSKFNLPKDHKELLKITNGLESFGGYFRLFGLGKERRINLLSWNLQGTWKFSWGDKLNDYICFGETAWGDQYAYHRDELSAEVEPKVYFIEGIAMAPEIISDSFNEFLEKEFLKNSIQPYDEMIVEVRNRLGNLSLEDHIVYTPSPLLGGAEDPANVQMLDSVTAMIINGDLYMQLAAESQDRPVKEIKPYVDKNGRNRIQVVWD